MDVSLEEACHSAFRQARLQKMYFPGEQFSFYFRLGRHSKDGPWNVSPSVHSIELALEHRKQLLKTMEKGTRGIRKMKTRLKTTSNAAKSAWQHDMQGMQRQLLGYIQCELHNRKSVKTVSGKRFRLLGKQPASPHHEGKMVLPWLTGLVVDKTKNNTAVQEGLRAFLNSDGVTRLQLFLRGALQKQTNPHLALEQAPRESARNSASLDDGQNRPRKRKPDSTRSGPRARATKGPSSGVGNELGEEDQDESGTEGWQPRLRPRVARSGRK